MSPDQLKAEHFNGYPPEARALAVENVQLLRQLPLSFLPLFLRELIVYDWKFPAERKELNAQLTYMAGLTREQLRQLMTPFFELRIAKELEQVDWVNAPREFSEQLTAHLWATHQMDAFRAAAITFGQKTDAVTLPQPPPIPRLGIVLIGRGVAESQHPLFRKLRPQGVHFKRIDPVEGTETLLQFVAARAKAHPLPFAHWYIDGASAENLAGGSVTAVSYEGVAPVRQGVLATMRKAVNAGSGPEKLRTILAQLQPEDLGMAKSSSDDRILRRFEISVLTEGSGTQVFSTTFVQWAAREALRRAQPITLLLRFAPRQRERPMNELLANTIEKPELEPIGSLVDADMGAYYTWINQQRLSGADRACFLVWFEAHNEALAIGPTMPRGTESDSPMTMAQVMKALI